MCGICGFVGSDGRADLSDVIGRMTAAIAHRGPDVTGQWASAGAALGHARLSIIDLSPAGNQPMSDPEGLIRIVYNGEVYNFAALRDELRQRGTMFRSRSDTEVILLGYLHWGVEVFARLEGMFAIGLWDARDETLHLARDPIGIKPLYYEESDRGLGFGSEIKALRAGRPGMRAMDPAGLHEYLWFGNALDERTLFASIRRLRPGHRLTWRDGAITMTPFRKPATRSPLEPPTFQQAVEQTRVRLDAAVRSHLVSDVPVGVFLSGGVDSSAMVALATRHYTGRLTTYSCGFDYVGRGNELPMAARVAAEFGTDHHELQVGTQDLPALLARMVRAHDEPFADAANLPLFLLCEALRGEVKVVLQGDGGDELFAGYRRYRLLRQLARWRGLGRLAFPFMELLQRSRRGRRLVRILDAMGAATDAERMALLLTIDTRRHSPALVLSAQGRSYVAGTDPFEAYGERAAEHVGADPVQQMLWTDLSILLPNTFLEKVDKSTMAHGIEVRVPMLDLPLVDWVAPLPVSLKVRNGRQKALLRAALRGIVPDYVLDAPKTGFDVPYYEWLRGPLLAFAQRELRRAEETTHGLVSSERALALLDEHRVGRWDHGFLLWKTLHLSLWCAESDVSL